MDSWKTFINNQTIEPLQKENALCALADIGLLFVGGEDASSFLQNQLSNDISHINPELAQLSSFSTAKGRLLAIFRVVQIDEGYILIMPRPVLKGIQQRLQKFILMAKVVLADITDSFASFTFISTPQELSNHEFQSKSINQVYQTDSLISLRLPVSNNDQVRYLVLSNEPSTAIQLWQKLAQKLTINGRQQWNLQEILAGIPTIYPQTSEAFVLQMANLQLIDGVSFKKGCYPGQEIVARMQYLGKLKRRMYLAEIDTGETPLPGTDLCSKGNDRPDNNGKVVDSVRLKDSKSLLLLIAPIDKLEANELKLIGYPNANLQLLKLPYLMAT